MVVERLSRPGERDDDDGSGITGRRNKSWREIDAQRGKSKYHSRQDDPGQQKIEKSASYEKYKQAADALFTGGVLPEALEQTFDPGGKRKEQKEAMMKLREVPDRKAWVQGVVEYLEKYPELHTLVNEATKLAGASGTKGAFDVATADSLLGKIDEIDRIFKETKAG